jgi:hypothetical protein
VKLRDELRKLHKTGSHSSGAGADAETLADFG